ncbi:hypothetical protein [Kingella denitrificans]|uniref:hypothetical protein n=1 Tax=Kingella denitrificans TaxID=502 RepID=UPI0012DE2084|nr:hypothetical protein [Kingella denitrificans]QQB41627.1 hypothetical protein I6I17_09080 [Kingella denitrificans]
MSRSGLERAGCFCHVRPPPSAGMAAQRHEHRPNTAPSPKAACTPKPNPIPL